MNESVKEPETITESPILTKVKENEYDSDSDDSYLKMPSLVRRVSSSSSSKNNDSEEDAISDGEDNDFFTNQNDKIIEEEDSTSTKTQTTAQLGNNPKVLRAMKNLESSFNPDAQKILEANDNAQGNSVNTSSDSSAHESVIGRDESGIGRDETEISPNNELPNLIADIAKIATTKSTDLVPKYVEPKTYIEA